MRPVHAAVFLCLLLGIVLIVSLFFDVRRTRALSEDAQRVSSNHELKKSGPSTETEVTSAYGSLPLSFEVNAAKGGTDQSFMARGRGYAIFLTPTGALLTLRKQSAARAQPDSGVGVSSPTTETDVLAMNLKGMRPKVAPEGLEDLPGKVNYLVGNEPAKWRTNIATYAKVRYENVYPGIDLVYYGNQRQLEYDFKVKPGVDARQIRLEFGRAKKLSLSAEGDLVVATAHGEARFLKPMSYQEVAGSRRSVDSHYVIRSRNEVALAIGSYDRNLSLVIDPVLAYSSYLGGIGDDEGYGIAVDSSGSAYITGETNSAAFPANSFQTTIAGDYDVFVTKLNPSGTAIIYSTFVGGTGFDRGNGIAIDTAGNAFIAGQTTSNNFPMMNALHSTYGGISDAFVFELNSSGSGLVYSTYFGGSSFDSANAIAIDQAGNAYVAGEADSRDFPTVNAFQPNKSGTAIFKSTNAAGSWTPSETGLLASNINGITYDPANSSIVYAAGDNGVHKSIDSGNTWSGVAKSQVVNPVTAIAVDPSNSSILYAATSLGIYKSTDGGGNFVLLGGTTAPIRGLVIDPVTPTKIYAIALGATLYRSSDGGSTWVGGNLSGLGLSQLNAIAIDPNTPATIYLGTNRGVFKSTNGAVTWTAANAGFQFEVVRTLAIDRSNSATLYFGSSTGIYQSPNGGTSWVKISNNLGSLSVTNIALDPSNSGVIYVSTIGGSVVYKTTDAGNNWSSANTGYSNVTVSTLKINPANSSMLLIGTSSLAEAFVTKLSAGGTSQLYSTYLGGASGDNAFGITVDALGRAYVTGYTISQDFPVMNALQGTKADAFTSDAFITKLDANGALAYSTYFGGNSSDFGQGIKLDGSNNILVAGYTFSTFIPGPGGPTPTINGGTDYDVFVTKLNPSGSAVLYTTPIGGSSTDQCVSLAVDAAGSAYVTGATSSSDFPVMGAPQPTFGGNFDAFITKLGSNGSMVYSTFLGGSSTDNGQSIAVDAAGNAYITGWTGSMNFPTVNPLRPYSGDFDVFVAKLGLAPDLAVTMTDSPDPVTLGNDLTYNIQVKNNGELAATGVTLTDTLPAGSTLVSANPGQGSCAGAATITCNLGTLASGGSTTIVIVIKPPAIKTISNTASASANEPDSNTANNSATESTQVLFADLSVLMTSASSKVAAGSKVIYLITARNNSGSTTSATINDTLPPETSFVSCNSTGVCGGAGNNRTVTFSSLAVGESASIVLVAQVGASVPDGVVVNNTATVTSSLPDNDTSNNSASASIIVSPLKLKGAGKIAFGSGRVLTVDADGSSAPVQVPNIPAAVAPAWSPDGTKIAYSYNKTVNSSFVREIDVANPDGTGILKIVDNVWTQNSRIAWSPSGTRIAYVGSDGPIYLANSDGSGFIKLQNTPSFINDLDWSPDGTKLLLSKDSDIYQIGLDGIILTKLSNSGTGPDGPFSYIKPRWSPDMSKILAVRKSNNLSDVVTMNVDGSGVARLLNAGGTSSPAWAPDATRLVFYVGTEVHAINLDGSNDIRLASGEVCCGLGSTDWQPLPGVTPPTPPTLPTAFTISGHINPFTFLLLSGTRSGSYNADSNGDYTFVNLPAGGTYTITPVSNFSNFNPTSRTYANLAGNQTDADFVIAGNINYSVSGRLSEPNGASIVGAELRVVGGFPDPLITTTDANGRYTFNNLIVNRTYSLFPTPNPTYGYVPNAQVFFFGDNTNRSQVVDFIGYKNTPVTISGRVTDGANPGTGVGGVTVRISSAGKSTSTDANGNYSFTNLTPGSDYTVTVDGPSFVWVTNQVPFKTVITDQQAYFVRYGPRQLRTISGRATSSSGTPMGSMLVTLSGDANMTTVTAADGSYSFTNVPDGFSYIVRPYRFGVSFAPSEFSLPNLAGDSAGNDFIGTNTTVAGTNAVFQFSSPFYNASEGSGSVTVTVNRAGSAREENVSYSTSNGTARDRSDYTLATGTLHFGAGESTKTFQILLTDDAFVENPETVFLTLRNPGAGELGPDSVATLTITDNDTSQPTVNPADVSGFFVRQHYADFLNREPDSSGLAFWVNEIASCGSDQPCIELKRINVSAAFYLSIEFQGTGYLVERLYKAAYGNANGTSTFGGTHQLPVPIVRLNEFLQDTQKIGQGLIVGQTGWEQVLENNKQAFTAEFVQRSRFTTAFPLGMTPAQFVDTLNTNAGNPLSQSERDQLVNDLSTNAKTRAQVLQAVAEDADLNNAEFNRAFVLMQYFGYLRRNPNDLQDTDYTGYDFWLTKLSQFNGNFVNAEMVKAFINSTEYRQRFGP